MFADFYKPHKQNFCLAELSYSLPIAYLSLIFGIKAQIINANKLQIRRTDFYPFLSIVYDFIRKICLALLPQYLRI
jgi:hypothetical protein